MYRKTYVEIDEQILENNVKKIIKKYNQYQYYIGVVKNNAYHHGIKIIHTLIEAGVNYLAVSSLEEALEVRKYNRDIPVLILEPIPLEYIDDCVNNNITITVENKDYVSNLCKIKLIAQLKVHIKIDSGMNRLGLKDKKEVQEVYELLKKTKNIFLEGIYTHLMTSGVNDFYYDKQIARFKELIDGIDLTEIPIVHVDRSLTLVKHEKLDFTTGVRMGIVMFGFNGSSKFGTGLKAKLRMLKRNRFIKKHHISPTILENDLQVKPAFKMYSHVLALRKVSKDEVVGYNASYKVKEDGYIATIPCGYADGVTKDFKYVFIKNNRYEIVADSSDMLMVLVDEKVKINDKVEIIGDNITIQEVCQRLGKNSYQLFNLIQNRVVRVYKNKDECIEVKY